MGGTGAGGTNASPVAQGDFANSYATAICSNVATCCTRFGYAFDQTSCASRAQADGASATAFDPAKVSYDASAAGACLAGIGALFQQCVVTGLGDPTPLSCGQIFVGKLPLGSPCQASEECAAAPGQGARCLPSDATNAASPTVCTASAGTAHGQLGAPCNGTCTNESRGLTCEAPPAVAGGGGASGTTSPTTAGQCYTNDNLYCVSTQHVCAEIPATGMPCPDGICRAGSYCDAGTATCTVAQGKNPCNADAACAGTDYCAIPPGAPQGNCSPRHVDGAACVEGNECANGGCNSKVCGPFSVAGVKTCAGRFF